MIMQVKTPRDDHLSGAITGPIGAGGSAMAKGASGLAKFGIRMGAGAVAGGVSGTVSETAKAIRGEEVSVGSFAKSIVIGAAAGTVGGASTHLASNVSKSVSSEVGKAVTRVSVQATSAAATDAGLQLIDKGEIDPKQLVLNTVGQITVATTGEVSQGMAKRTDAYNQKVNRELIQDDVEKKNVPKEMKSTLEDSLKTVNEGVPPNVLEDHLKEADVYKGHQQKLTKIQDNPDLTFVQKEEQQREYNRQNNLPESKTKRIINNEIYKSERVGDNNVHKLTGGREGQIAMDIKTGTEKRGPQRIIAEVRHGKYVYSEYLPDHNYDGPKKDILIVDPYDALRPGAQHIVRDLPVDDDIPEDIDDKGDKKND